MEERPPRHYDSVPEQYLVLVTCREERHQAEVIERLMQEGLICKALMS